MAQVQVPAQAQGVNGGAANPQFVTKSLYVGDLDVNVNDSQLYDVFNQVAQVVSVRVCRDLTTRRSLGYGYVNYSNPQDAARALDLLNFTPLNGKPIRIMYSHHDPSLRKSGAGNIGEGEGYKPEAAFQEDTREQLFDLSLTNSTELWLIQWPFNEVPDFNGKEISLNLHHDGCLGSFEASVGKTYDVVSSAVQEPDATVFVSSSSKTKIVGKISRRVSLVHYPDPEELEKQETEKKSKRRFRMSGGSSLVNSSYHSVTPTQSTKLRNSNMSRGTTSSHSSRHKSSLSEVGDDSAALKRRRIHKHNAPTDRPTLDAGRGQSIYTISGLSDIHPEEN